ncbi:MAG: carbohydrate ABC transporter permease [Eubacteriales bacterium]
MGQKRKRNTIGFYLFVILFVGSMVLPFIWLFLSSVKTRMELFTVPIAILPAELQWNNYLEVFEVQPFGDYIRNSIVTATISTTVILVISCMASYSLARVQMRGKTVFLMALLSVSLLPPVTLLSPMYELLSAMSLLNTSLGLALAIAAIELPMAVWFLTGYFQNVPDSLEESGMLDGASYTQIFLRIICPLVTPGIFTIGILMFINSWNNYLFALVFNSLPSARTATVAITLFQSDYTIPWEIISAASIILTAPLVIVVLILQKWIVSGMLDGGVKG